MGSNNGDGGVSWNFRYYYPCQTVSDLIRNNIIEDNQPYNAGIKVAQNVSIANNWWGTFVSGQIEQTIHDYQGSSCLGKISFQPSLSARPFHTIQNVTFSETGLPPKTAWSISLNGTLHTSTGSLNDFPS